MTTGTVPLSTVPVARLTPRERQVLTGLSHGLSLDQIGRRLYITRDTVKIHTRNLYRKLGARNQAHAVAIGYQAGLL